MFFIHDFKESEIKFCLKFFFFVIILATGYREALSGHSLFSLEWKYGTKQGQDQQISSRLANQ